MQSSSKDDSLNLLSIVIPCYNEEECIERTIDRMTSFSNELISLNVELIFVDDGSHDQTRQILRRHASADARIKVIGFARNFGHQIAITAGIDAATGDAVVLIDADLQDPPEVINEMIAQWRAGFDVVYGQRTERDGESTFKLASARAFYRLINKFSDVPLPLDAGDFRLMSRPVIDSLRAMPERDRFLRGMVSWVGFNQIAVPYRRSARVAGETKYPLGKMLRFAIDGILSFSAVPLRLAVTLGFFSAILSLFGILYALVLRAFTNVWVEGWTALFIAVLFFCGAQLVCIGILGEYIGRIYNEVKRRPLYVVEEYFGFDNCGPVLTRSPVAIRMPA